MVIFVHLDNCPKCGQLFLKRQESICISCLKERESDKEKIKAWINSSHTLTLETLFEDTGVNEKTFRDLLAEGRIKTLNRVRSNCDICGATIIIKSRHVLCETCRDKIKNLNGGIHSCFHSKREDDEE